MSIYGRFFKPEEKSTLRKVIDRVDAMSPMDCRAYIQSSWDAMCELYKVKNDDGSFEYNVAANERHEQEHKPLIEYIDACIEHANNRASTEADIDLANHMKCIKDIIIEDIYDVYTPNGYGDMQYDHQYVMNVLLEDRAKNITMWPMMKWACEWNPKMKEYRKLYDKYEKIGREEN